MLTVEGVYGGYGGVDILCGFSLAVAAGELVVIVGPNGAGKSTALKAIAGLVRVRSGFIRYKDRDITRLRADRVAASGIGYVPQERNVFPRLTVLENLEMGAFLGDVDVAERVEFVFGLFPQLRDLRRQASGSLSGGERQFVAIGRALMREPPLLMLDEPTAGLSPKFTDVVFDKIREINANGVAVLMVEQNARQALAIADRGYVLTLGKNRFEDAGPALLANREVASMFLGG